MSTEASGSITLEIFGAPYVVRGAHDREHLQTVAALVDEKMRAIAAHFSSPETTRVAILAALNLADELLQARRQQEGERVEVQERVSGLTATLARVL
jgi:cell division protein ZapA